MSALDDGEFGCEPVTDLDILARDRRAFLARGIRMPLQDAERAAGLTDADIWAFETKASWHHASL